RSPSRVSPPWWSALPSPRTSSVDGSGSSPHGRLGRRRPADSLGSPRDVCVYREAATLTVALRQPPADPFIESFLAELRARVPTSKDELHKWKRRVARS